MSQIRASAGSTARGRQELPSHGYIEYLVLRTDVIGKNCLGLGADPARLRFLLDQGGPDLADEPRVNLLRADGTDIHPSND